MTLEQMTAKVAKHQDNARKMIAAGNFPAARVAINASRRLIERTALAPFSGFLDRHDADPIVVAHQRADVWLPIFTFGT